MEFSEYVAARGQVLERFAYVLTGDADLELHWGSYTDTIGLLYRDR